MISQKIFEIFRSSFQKLFPSFKVEFLKVKIHLIWGGELAELCNSSGVHFMGVGFESHQRPVLSYLKILI